MHSCVARNRGPLICIRRITRFRYGGRSSKKMRALAALIICIEIYFLNSENIEHERPKVTERSVGRRDYVRSPNAQPFDQADIRAVSRRANAHAAQLNVATAVFKIFI